MNTSIRPGLARCLVTPLLLLGVLGGCGGSSNPTPSVSTLQSYTDPVFGFTFKYPSNWQVPAKQGKTETVSGVKTYVVTVKAPSGTAQLQLTVDGQIITFPPFVDGKVSPDPKGGPDSFHYQHAQVSGYPAMRVERWNGQTMDEIDTFINTRTKAYDVRMDTGTPPFSGEALAAYKAVVRTLKLGLT